MIRRFLTVLPLLGIMFDVAAAAADRASAITARRAQISGDMLRTRFIADFSRKVSVSFFTLADPYRVVIDLPNVAFALSAESGRRGKGLISSYRFGQFAPGKSRIVLDASTPVSVDAVYVTEAARGKPARLVVDLVSTDRKTFLRNAAPNLPSPRRRPRPSPDVRSRVTVVIDPGHGGVDPGALGADGIAEKTITLGVAKVLKERLEQSGRFHVALTREHDRFVPLGERVRVAREEEAALFLSLHADSIDSTKVRGATVYILSETASDPESAALAHKENRADIIAGLNLSEPDEVLTDILLDLTQRETRNLSVAVAKSIVEKLEGTTRLNKNPFRAAGFRVLRAPDVPSVLVELGYLSSDEDIELLTSTSWREEIAEALAQAIESALPLAKSPVRGPPAPRRRPVADLPQ